MKGAAFGNAWLLLTLATLCWGGNAVAGKLAAGEWLPFTLTTARWACAALLLLPFAWGPLREDWPVLRRHLPLMFLLGGVGMCLFNLLMFLALNHTTAINVSIEQAIMPLLIMVANFVVFSQRVRALQLVGLALSILGVLVTTTDGRPLDFFTSGLNRGDALMLLACVFYAGYTFGLRWRPPLHWLSYMWAISISALLMTLPFTAWELSRATQPMPGAGALLALLYIVIFPTVVSQIAYARGVELIGGNRAGQFINLVPVFGAALAVLILGERFAWYHGAGLVLVLGGITLAERTAARSAADAAEAGSVSSGAESEAGAVARAGAVDVSPVDASPARAPDLPPDREASRRA